VRGKQFQGTQLWWAAAVTIQSRLCLRGASCQK